MFKNNLNKKIIILISILVLLTIGILSLVYFKSNQKSESGPTALADTKSSLKSQINQPKTDSSTNSTPDLKSSVFPLLYSHITVGESDKENFYDQSGNQYKNPKLERAFDFNISSDSSQIIATMPDGKIGIWNYLKDTYTDLKYSDLYPLDTKTKNEFVEVSDLSISQDNIYYRLLESSEILDTDPNYDLCSDAKCGVFEYSLNTKKIRKISDKISYSQYDGSYSNSIFEIANNQIVLNSAKTGDAIFNSNFEIIDLSTLKTQKIILYRESEQPASSNPSIKINVVDKSNEKILLDFGCEYSAKEKINQDCVDSLKAKINNSDLFSSKLQSELLASIDSLAKIPYQKNKVCGKYSYVFTTKVKFDGKDFKPPGDKLGTLKCLN